MTAKAVIQNTPLIVRVVCLYVAAFTIIVLASQINQPAPIAQSILFADVPQMTNYKSKTIVSGYPKKLSIVRLGISLPVINGTYDEKKNDWTLSDHAVQFATMTTLPNNVYGNTFIYGHNTSAVLEPVKDLRVGDIATVTTTNGKTFTYAYTRDQIVKPNKTDILDDTPAKPRLTLMTCEGFFSLTRRIMYFDFKGVA